MIYSFDVSLTLLLFLFLFPFLVLLNFLLLDIFGCLFKLDGICFFLSSLFLQLFDPRRQYKLVEATNTIHALFQIRGLAEVTII